MEIELNDEQNNIYTEEINNHIVLRYKLQYFSKNYLKQPIFEKWFNKEKNTHGKYKGLYKCKNCNSFVYIEETNHYSFKCCENSHLEYICTYCGSVYYGDSYCCIKRGLKSDFREYLLDGSYSCTKGLYESAKAFPLVFHIAFSGTIFCALFLHRRGSNTLNINSSYETKDTSLSHIAKIIILLFILSYSILFYIPLSFIHFIYLYIFFKVIK